MNTKFKSDLSRTRSWSVAELIGDRFARYAKYVIQDRALPDVRDGLKPVQRRILYAMLQLKLIPTSSFRKAARVVGEVIGKYHPHGDTSVYEALVKLSQSWRRRYPLISIQGNNGSIDGDPPAAMRYTETKLTPLAFDCLLTHLAPPVVQFKPNFDESDQEPVVLAAGLPMLLLNGSSGIAAGYATNIPPHNLSEIIKALTLLVQKSDASLDQILTLVQGPDFPTGGTIERANLKSIYETGKGRIQVRANFKVSGREILIDQIPYDQSKATVVFKIKQVIAHTPFLTGHRVVDESDRFGLKIRLYLPVSADPHTTMNFLFQATPLAINYQVNMVAIVNDRPQVLGLLAYLKHFIRFHSLWLRTYFCHQLKVINTKLHILLGISQAVKQLDHTIQLIRQAHSRLEAQTALVTNLNLTTDQADAVVKLRLYQLTATDLEDLNQQTTELTNQKIKINSILTDKAKFISEQIQLWAAKSDRFGDDRRTQLVDQFRAYSLSQGLVSHPNQHHQLIELIVTRDGYLSCRVVAKTGAKIERRLKNQDQIILHQIHPHAGYLSLVTNYGQAFWLSLAKLNINPRQALEQHLSQITRLTSGSKFIYAIWTSNSDDRWLMCLNNGKAKIVLNQDCKISERVKKVINLPADSELITCCRLPADSEQVLIGTRFNRWLLVRVSQIPIQKLMGSGGKLMTLIPPDQVQLCTPINSSASKLVMIGSDQTIKIVPITQIKIANRGAKGGLIYFDAWRKVRLVTGFIASGSQLKLCFVYNHQIQTVQLDLTLKNKKQLINHLSELGISEKVRLFLSPSQEPTDKLKLEF